nr:MAG TPA: hypothetical protein [Caudoviricetes sp.]
MCDKAERRLTARTDGHFMGRTVWAREHRNPALAGSTPAGPTNPGLDTPG